MKKKYQKSIWFNEDQFNDLKDRSQNVGIPVNSYIKSQLFGCEQKPLIKKIKSKEINE